MGGFIHLVWHVPTGPTSPRQSIAVWALSTITNEAINRELQRVATGATAAPTDTDHSTAYPGGGSSNKIMAVASTTFPRARSAKRDENQAIDPKYGGKAQDFDSFIAVAVPAYDTWYTYTYMSHVPRLYTRYEVYVYILQVYVR